MLKKISPFVRHLLPFGSLFLIVVFLSIAHPESFLTFDNLLNVLRRSSVFGIMSVGMTLVVITGGIDLSVGSMLALCGMAAATVFNLLDPGLNGTLTASLVGVLVGLTAGSLNGVLTAGLKLPPFIATLATMSLFRGMALVWTDGQAINVPAFQFLGEGLVMGIPISILIFLFILGGGFFVFRYTTFGRYSFAIGSNREAAWYSGLKVNRHLFWVYALSGALVGAAAMIATSRTVSAQPTAGNGAELDVIAAVVIGGASLSGGRGGVVGTLVGTLLISFLRNGCTLMGISTNAQLIVIGVIIAVAVAVDRKARGEKN
jgi:ribose/xylose/arabinose/galactoside ABC-type transport system permease subunit